MSVTSYSSSVLSEGNAEFESSYKIEYSVTHLAIDAEDAPLKEYLCRADRDEDAYFESCGAPFKLALFPTKASRDKCRPEYIRLAELVTGIRVQRLVLSNEIRGCIALLARLKELRGRCAELVSSEERRTCMLERELSLVHAQHAHVSAQLGNVAACLCLPSGWSIFQAFVFQEKRRKDRGEEAHVRGGRIEELWTTQQYWSLFRSVELLCRVGRDRFDKHVASVPPAAPPRRSSVTSATPMLSFVSNPSSPLCAMHVLVDVLGAESDSPQDLAAAVAATLKSVVFDGVVLVFTRESVAAHAIEMTRFPDDLTSAVGFADAMLLLLNDIAEYLGQELLPGVRRSGAWGKLLQEMRKSRVDREGGKLLVREDEELEIDCRGMTTSLPASVRHIDTDVLHHSMQRLDVDVCLAAILERRVHTESKLRTERGELACLVQFGFECCIGFLQRVWRGALGRARARAVRHRVLRLVLHAAALTLQCWVRTVHGKCAFRELLALYRQGVWTNNAVLLQKVIRGWTKWHVYQRHKQRMREEELRRAAVLFQALARGFLARRGRVKLRGVLAKMRETLVQNWAATSVQKIVRGFLARHVLIRTLIVRKQLNPKLLHLTEKYLQKGDLWKFLEEIGFEMNVLQQKLKDNQQWENEMADTFISKVLVRRQRDFDSAWDQFSSSVSRGARGDAEDREKFLTAIGGKGRGDARILRALASASPEKRTQQRSDERGPALPGPLIRRAVTSTVMDQVRSSALLAESTTARSAVAQLQMSAVYGGGGRTEEAGRTASHRSPKRVSSETYGASSGRKARTASRIRSTQEDWLSSTPSAIAVTEEFAPPSKLSTSTSPHRSPSKHSLRQSRKWLPSTAALPPLAEAGESLLVDIPLGVEDKVDLLLRAAALRCYVPPFFAGTNVDEAYSIYTRLPPSLARVRYEQESMRWCQQVINNLKESGIRYIKELSPPSKLRLILRQMGASEVLVGQCSSIAGLLATMKSIPAGKRHMPTSMKSREVLQGASRVLTVSAASKERAASPEKAAQQDSVAKVDESAIMGLLKDQVEDGPWASVSADVEELIVHAAFIVVSNSDESIELGQNQYLEHMRELLAVKSEEKMRLAVRTRYRHALQLCTPFLAQLRKRRCLTVRDLAVLDLDELGMPAPLFDQVDALLSTAIAKSAGSKTGFLSFEGMDVTAKVRVPLVYDPKFQRSPFDPFGRSARVATLRDIVQHKSNMIRMEKVSILSENDELPFGLWDVLPGRNDSMYTRTPAAVTAPKSVGFADGVRSYECSECGMCFGRLASLMSHELTHTYEGYGAFKSAPQLYFDDDQEAYAGHLRDHVAAATSLPPLVRQEIDRLH